ncbi:D-(-)-3-hydroxybutyrate oligomer hydrolase, partial [Novilysobacter defluvii]
MPSRTSVSTTRLPALATLAVAIALAGCASAPVGPAAQGTAAPAVASSHAHERVSVHRDGDDLLTAGLGLAGLQSMQAPAFADPEAPTASELRRRAIW